mgnify:CR=1 FL=1
MDDDNDTEEETKSKENKTDVILVDKNFKYSHIYSYNLNYDSVTQITKGNFSVNNFDYSPKGERMIFSHQDDTNINTGFVNTDISLIESDGSNMKNIITRPGLDSNPIFSGDGNKFAFISSGGRQESIGLRDVYIYDLENQKTIKLSDTPNRDSNIISWSSDNKLVIISENVNTTSQVIMLPVNGNRYISWSYNKYKVGVISSVVKSKQTDNIVLCYENLDSPVEVYVSNSKEPSFNKISSINNFDYPKLSKNGILLVDDYGRLLDLVNPWRQDDKEIVLSLCH